MRNKKLFSLLGLTTIATQLLACGKSDFKAEPIVFEQPEQPAPIEESESTYEDASYVIVDDSEEEELVDEEEILKELGCYVAETEEEAKVQSTSQSVAKVENSTSTSSSSAKTIKYQPINSTDTFVKTCGSSVMYITTDGEKYYIDHYGVGWIHPSARDWGF